MESSKQKTTQEGIWIYVIIVNHGDYGVTDLRDLFYSVQINKCEMQVTCWIEAIHRVVNQRLPGMKCEIVSSQDIVKTVEG